MKSCWQLSHLAVAAYLDDNAAGAINDGCQLYTNCFSLLLACLNTLMATMAFRWERDVGLCSKYRDATQTGVFNRSDRNFRATRTVN